MGSAQYRIDVYDELSNIVYVLTDFTSLSYTRRVNSPSIVRIKLRGDHPALADLTYEYKFEIWRAASDGVWVREVVAVYRSLEWKYGSQSDATLTAEGVMAFLGDRVVAYPANTTNRTKFVGAKAETIAKTLVKYNLGPDSHAGRVRDGRMKGVSVQADGATGNTLDWYCAWQNLLETLQELSVVGGGDFDLVKTGVLGAPDFYTTYEFRWYNGQLGTDRTATVLFAMNRGNMANPTYVENRLGQRTVAIVGGKGEEADRAVIFRTSADYDADENEREVFVNATDVETTTGLNLRGDAKLVETAEKREFKFDVLQTPGTEYGVHYWLGDLVQAVNPFTNNLHTLKVESVVVALNPDGREDIKVELKEV